MFRKFEKPRGVVWAGIGLVVGLLLATGLWPQTPLHAVATDRCESFAISTGYCDDSIEAVWFLDFVTGDLRAVVLSKQSGTFNAFFSRNITADLAVDASKSPRFVIASGAADLRRTGGTRVATSRSILYVAEGTSGIVAAYSIPWSSAAWTSGQRQAGQILLLDKTRFRNVSFPSAGPEPKE